MWPFDLFKKKKKKQVKEESENTLPEKTYSQLKSEFSTLEIENAEKEDQCAKDGNSWSEMLVKTKDVKEKLAHLDKLMRKMQEPSLTYNKKWKGKKITLDEFITASVAKEITDMDGEGYYASETAKSDIRAYPSDFVENIYRTDFPYILWIAKQ